MVREQKKTPEQMDRRLIDVKLLRGQMSEKQLSKYLETLPDVSENAEEVAVVMEERK
jgi:hypothetical protein